jgi:hypothetical protein
MFNPADLGTAAMIVLSGGALVIGFLFGYLVRDYFADKRLREIETRLDSLDRVRG